jgi:hypothetical protein
MKFNRMTIALAMLTASACATATTTVREPAARDFKSETVAIEHGSDTVSVEEEYGTYFRNKLAQELYADGGFAEGEGMVLQYRFIQLDQGSRAARYMFGPIAGKGTMKIEIVFLDAERTEIATIETGGEVSGGFFGGSFKSALDKAAQETADYAIAKFRQ